MYNTPKFQNLQRRRKDAEIRLLLFITEHNISLRTSDHLVQLVKTLAPESEVLKNVSCNRAKATSIVKNVVGEYAFEILVDKMKKQYFSIIIHESTDITHLTIIERMVDNDRFVVKNDFACLKEISKSTANNVLEEIMNFFQKYQHILGKNKSFQFVCLLKHNTCIVFVTIYFFSFFTTLFGKWVSADI